MLLRAFREVFEASSSTAASKTRIHSALKDVTVNFSERSRLVDWHLFLRLLHLSQFMSKDLGADITNVDGRLLDTILFGLLVVF